MEEPSELNSNFLEELEEIVNQYLTDVHELEYAIMHFMKKTNKSTALAVRNAQRAVTNTSKDFKRTSLSFFGS